MDDNFFFVVVGGDNEKENRFFFFVVVLLLAAAAVVELGACSMLLGSIRIFVCACRLGVREKEIREAGGYYHFTFASFIFIGCFASSPSPSELVAFASGPFTTPYTVPGSCLPCC